MCTFTVVLSDGYLYGSNSKRYPNQSLTVVRSNELPYFAEDLPREITFKSEGVLEYVLPDKIDPNGDQVDVLIGLNNKFPWLGYDPEKNALVVAEGTTTEDDVGTYEIGLTLDDGYEYGSS